LTPRAAYALLSLVLMTPGDPRQGTPRESTEGTRLDVEHLGLNSSGSRSENGGSAAAGAALSTLADSGRASKPSPRVTGGRVVLSAQEQAPGAGEVYPITLLDNFDDGVRRLYSVRERERLRREGRR